MRRPAGRPTRRPTSCRTALALVVGVTVLLASGACSDDQQPLPPLKLNTTTVPPASPDLTDGVVPKSATAIVADIESAATSNDVCKLLAVMDDAMPDPTDPSGAMEVYDALAAATRKVRGSVPADLTDPWADLVTGTEDASAALRRANGDLGDPEFKAAFRRTTTVVATELVERFGRTNCT